MRFFTRFWLPLLCWMGIIFLGSTDAFSVGRTSRFIGPVLRIFFPQISPEQIRKVQFAVRKTAHAVEYAVFSILLLRVFSAHAGIMRAVPWPWLATLTLLLAFLYALSDEWHQSFSQTRMGSGWDVLIDTVGALAGVLAWRAWKKRG